MRISDLSSDVCSSDLTIHNRFDRQHDQAIASAVQPFEGAPLQFDDIARAWFFIDQTDEIGLPPDKALRQNIGMVVELLGRPEHLLAQCGRDRSEEHTSELQSLMRISYAVFCLKK